MCIVVSSSISALVGILYFMYSLYIHPEPASSINIIPTLVLVSVFTILFPNMDHVVKALNESTRDFKCFCHVQVIDANSVQFPTWVCVFVFCVPEREDHTTKDEKTLFILSFILVSQNFLENLNVIKCVRRSKICKRTFSKMGNGCKI